MYEISNHQFTPFLGINIAVIFLINMNDLFIIDNGYIRCGAIITGYSNDTYFKILSIFKILTLTNYFYIIIDMKESSSIGLFVYDHIFPPNYHVLC